MKLKKFFAPVNDIGPDEARAFISNHREGSYTLLDVRQPKEYEKSRIPGAKLIPLPELTDRLGELTPEKPVIAY
ncbi:rhodanese-like domain-containing protein [Thermodesulfobacteriota bacterium]